MKSIEDLKRMREQSQRLVDLRNTEKDYRIVVGMATCGIAAGAREVLHALNAGIAQKQINNTILTQTGCIGMCTLEPIVEIYDKEGNKTTYVKVDVKKANEILDSHILKETVLADYTVGAYKQ
ncbi:MAG: (2Fe-2S) ferredoxin domain-containing protein [Erysipelotrichaceae bacterium]